MADSCGSKDDKCLEQVCSDFDNPIVRSCLSCSSGRPPNVQTIHTLCMAPRPSESQQRHLFCIFLSPCRTATFTLHKTRTLHPSTVAHVSHCMVCTTNVSCFTQGRVFDSPARLSTVELRSSQTEDTTEETPSNLTSARTSNRTRKHGHNLRSLFVERCTKARVPPHAERRAYAFTRSRQTTSATKRMSMNCTLMVADVVWLVFCLNVDIQFDSRFVVSVSGSLVQLTDTSQSLLGSRLNTLSSY